MNILDRLNLYFKIKSFVNVPFNDVEMDFVNRIEKLRNFKEVEEIASRYTIGSGWVHAEGIEDGCDISKRELKELKSVIRHMKKAFRKQS